MEEAEWDIFKETEQIKTKFNERTIPKTKRIK